MNYDLDILNRLGFRKKALPVPGTTAVVVSGFSSSTLKGLKAYAEEGYCENPIVFACITMIAEAASSVKLELHKTDDKDNVSVVTSHPILKLLRKPNPTQSWSDFCKEMVAWYKIAGELFILRLPEKGPARELYLLDPSAMTVKHDKEGNPVPLEYIYGKNPESAKHFKVDFVTGESQVMHLKTFNPFDSFRGLPPMRAAARAIDIHNNGATWNNALLQNSARPSGIVTFEGPSNPGTETLNQMREYFKKAWQGMRNAGNVPLLTGGAKFQPLSHTPKDMDFEKSTSEANKNIAMVLGVPLPLVTMDAATFSNTEQAEERLWIDTVLPLLNTFLGGLTRFLMPTMAEGKEGKAGQFLAYNLDSIPALEARRERLYKRMRSVTGGPILTQNEARIEMGFPEKEGAGELSSGNPEPEKDEAEKDPKDKLKKSLAAMGYSEKDIRDVFGEQEAA